MTVLQPSFSPCLRVFVVKTCAWQLGVELA